MGTYRPFLLSTVKDESMVEDRLGAPKLLLASSFKWILGML